jgi:hypothetical protein
MADSKNTTSQAPQGSGPLGQSGVSPSGTVQRNYQNEFVGPHRPRGDFRLQVPCPPSQNGPKDRR